jgi:hypothetical protein
MCHWALQVMALNKVIKISYPETNGVKTASDPHGKMGSGISIAPLSEVGKASRLRRVGSARSSKWCCNKKRPSSAHHAHDVLEKLTYLHMLADASA